MSTAASGDSPYCSVDQFLRRYDARSVAQLLSDTRTPIASDALADNEVLADLLAEASGQVEAAACTGQRYVIDQTRNDLASLTGNSAAFLAGMVSHIAMYLLWNRRPAMMASMEPPPLYKRAEDFLEQLRLGERVFGILESHEAGRLEADPDSPAQVEARNGIVYQSERFFGTRVNRLQP